MVLEALMYIPFFNLLLLRSSLAGNTAGGGAGLCDDFAMRWFMIKRNEANIQVYWQRGGHA
jgi:hypothetical protein